MREPDEEGYARPLADISVSFLYQKNKKKNICTYTLKRNASRFIFNSCRFWAGDTKQNIVG